MRWEEIRISGCFNGCNLSHNVKFITCTLEMCVVKGPRNSRVEKLILYREFCVMSGDSTGLTINRWTALCAAEGFCIPDRHVENRDCPSQYKENKWKNFLLSSQPFNTKALWLLNNERPGFVWPSAPDSHPPDSQMRRKCSATTQGLTLSPPLHTKLWWQQEIPGRCHAADISGSNRASGISGKGAAEETNPCGFRSHGASVWQGAGQMYAERLKGYKGHWVHVMFYTR